MSQVSPVENSTWRQVAAVVNGRQVPVGSGVVLHVDPEGYTVTVYGRMFQRGTSRKYPDTVPCELDVIVTEGAEAGKTVPQIFQIAGDLLIACQAPAGAARPTEFASQPGSGHTLSVWLRIDPATAGQYSPGVMAWRLFPVIAAVLVATNASQGIREDLAAGLGYWPSLMVSGLIGVIVVYLISRSCRWSWQDGLTLGLTMSVGMHVLEEVKAAIDPALGSPLATFVAASAAFVAAVLVGGVMSKLLKSE